MKDCPGCIERDQVIARQRADLVSAYEMNSTYVELYMNKLAEERRDIENLRQSHKAVLVS